MKGPADEKHTPPRYPSLFFSLTSSLLSRLPTAFAPPDDVARLDRKREVLTTRSTNATTTEHEMNANEARIEV